MVAFLHPTLLKSLTISDAETSAINDATIIIKKAISDA